MNKWVLGARPRTLPAAVVPVAVGVAAAAGSSNVVWWRSALALVVSLSLQVGVNYANDYSDGIRGTDENRVGPVRLVGNKLASPRSVKTAAFIAFGVAGASGFALALMTTLWLLVVGAAAIAAAWYYTGGPRPYGYAGLGEVFVFVFFGLVATVGSQYAVSERTTAAGWFAAVAVGAFACCLLVINNLRDIPGDTQVGKNTLAVRMGDQGTRKFFALLVILAAVAVLCSAASSGVAACLGLVGVMATKPALDVIAKGAKGRDLIPVLGAVGRAQMILGASYALGLVIALR